ncbi:MAG: hypothetical protein EU535_00875 [Promethearchaeota archaeon]|nr:MAG: hypothetical protein EU535_00875 [Candidatus Lokiarchaeota archaeon]
MSITVPTYAYTYIKIEILKQIVMDDDTLKQLKNINDIVEIIEFIKPYYPDLTIEKYSIEEIEVALYNIFVKIIGKILFFSPKNMRKFLKGYLLQFEIRNIKQIILGLILGTSKDEVIKNINFLVEEYLENTEFLKRLLEMTSLDEIRLFMKGTKYYEAIREGILYFKNNNEIFVLEAFLDQLYYKNLRKNEKEFNQKEKDFLMLYINSMSEIYNLNTIYRGIINNIDKKLLSQFLVENYLFLKKNQIDALLNNKNLNDFISNLEEIFKNIDEIKRYYRTTGIIKEHLHWWIEGLYIYNFFEKFKEKIDDIDYTTIFRIIEILIKKEKEIKFDIIPYVIKIIHEKYELLENYERSKSKLKD